MKDDELIKEEVLRNRKHTVGTNVNQEIIIDLLIDIRSLLIESIDKK